MRTSTLVLNAAIITFSLIYAPLVSAQAPAVNSIQPSQPTVARNDPSVQTPPRVLNLPAGMRLDIETAYTVNSRDIRLGDLLTFRVLVPVRIEGFDVIP